MGLLKRIRLGSGFGLLGAGLYTALYPYNVMSFFGNYIDSMPDGEAFGVPYKSMLGVAVGVGATITGLALLLDT